MSHYATEVCKCPSGEQHKFTVVVNKTSSGINVGISDWKSDGTDNGGSAE